MSKNHLYLQNEIRRHDPDRYLLSLFVPARYRPALHAVFMFNHEIAKTREVVSETQLGLIRLQWWRERIAEIYDGLDQDKAAPEHEVLQGLEAAIREYGLSQEYFDALVFAREFDLEDVCPSHVDGVIHYADYTGAPLLRLVMQIMGDDPDQDMIYAIAVNYGLIGLIRAVPFFGNQRRCYLPEDLMQDHGVRPSKLYEGKDIEGVSKIVETLSSHIVQELKPSNKFLRGTQTLAMIYLKQLQSSGYDPFSSRMAVPPAFKEIRILRKQFFLGFPC